MLLFIFAAKTRTIWDKKEDIEKTENKIIFIREQRVILDRDVAELYGVETRRINEALKNNPEKFPDGYVIELTDKEKQYVVENFDHLEKAEVFSCSYQSFHGERLVYACHHPQISIGYRGYNCHC